MNKTVELNDGYSDENFHSINLYMELAMQVISNDETVRSNTVQNLKDFESQCLVAQVKKGEQTVSMMPAIKKAFDLMSDHIVELSTRNESLKKNKL